VQTCALPISLYFTAGPGDESHGLFGKLTTSVSLAAQTRLTGPMLRTVDVRHGHFTGFLELRNESKTTINGPITIIFDRLPAGVTLNNATGFTAGGKPFITIDSATLAKHKSLKVFLDFNTTTRHLGAALN